MDCTDCADFWYQVRRGSKTAELILKGVVKHWRPLIGWRRFTDNISHYSAMHNKAAMAPPHVHNLYCWIKWPTATLQRPCVDKQLHTSGNRPAMNKPRSSLGATFDLQAERWWEVEGTFQTGRHLWPFRQWGPACLCTGPPCPRLQSDVTRHGLCWAAGLGAHRSLPGDQC